MALSAAAGKPEQHSGAAQHPQSRPGAQIQRPVAALPGHHHPLHTRCCTRARPPPQYPLGSAVFKAAEGVGESSQEIVHTGIWGMLTPYIDT